MRRVVGVSETRVEPAVSADVLVQVSAGASVRCHQYAKRPPILAIWGPAAAVSISPVPDEPPSLADVRFARELQAAVAAYAAECERLCPDKEDTSPAETALA